MRKSAVSKPLPLGSLATMTLHSGSHPDRTNGLCAMEVVAWVAGEPHTDQPLCACPVIGAFVRSWNDAIPDDETRTRLLKPLLSRLVNTKSTAAVEQRRADLALDWLVRVQTPAWLDLVQLTAEATALRALQPLLNRVAIIGSQAVLNTARDRAAAARAAAWDAASAAARDAASAATRAAARAAATHKLKPTVEFLQISALDLIDRMIRVTPESL